jgi:hypothetical protein
VKVFVIHQPERTDREANISRLRERFPNLELVNAHSPEWEQDLGARALRGCTAAHLLLAQQALHGEPVLVLEDDAVMEGELPSFDGIPSNVGIVLLGGDAPYVGDELPSGFRLFYPPFFGTQAVLYLPRPSLFAFLLDAMGSSLLCQFGLAPNMACTESILYFSGSRTGYMVCRPSTMIFSTLGDLSSSRGVVVDPRKAAWSIQDRDSLLPWESWDAVFSPWAGRKAALLVVPGNAGDILINAATRQLFRHHGITEVPIDEAEVLFYPGGGNIGTYHFKDQTEAFRSSAIPKVVLPHTIGSADPYLDLADEVWLRDQESIRLYPRGKYAPDLALAYRSALTLPTAAGDGVAFRKDHELVEGLSSEEDPAMKCRDHYEYLLSAARFERIHTNRLHYAIAGLIAGREVTLYPNSYHKNRAVWESELASLGCKWKESYP